MARGDRKREKARRRERIAIIPPYTVLPNGWRHPAWWLAPALAVFCFFYGAVYAYSTPYWIVPMMAPVVALAGFAIWALPDQRKGPEASLWPLLYAFVIALVIWPNYFSIDLASLPWISILRLIGTPLMLVLLIAFSVSRQFRAEIGAVVKAAPVIAILVAAFSVIQFLVIPLSGNVGESLSRSISQQMIWTSIFFASCWIFRKPGRIVHYSYLICILALVIVLMGIWEAHLRHPIWQGHVPGFLKVDSSVHYTGSSMRRYTNIYRVKTTFSTPLGMSEFLALCMPFFIHFVLGYGHKMWVRITAGLLIPVVLVSIASTDSRLGLIGSMVSILSYSLAWALLRWRRDKGSLGGPALLSAYPAGALALIAATFVSKRLHDMVWGGGVQRSSSNSRILQLKMGLPHILHNPIGYGAGRAGPTLGFSPASFVTVDDYYLSVCLDYGVAGLAIFVGIFVSAIAYAVTWIIKTIKTRDEELEYLLPLAVIMFEFMVMKMVFSEESNHPLVFMNLGMIAALVWRAKGGAAELAAAPAPSGRSRSMRIGREQAA